jgi:hypothetical protein
VIGALGKEEYFTFATTQRVQTMTVTTDLEGIVLDDVAENPGTGSRGQQLQ